MKGERHPARLAVAETRERVLERLSDAFAQDQLGLEMFEAPPRAELAPAAPASTAPRVLALLGNVERGGPFRLEEER